MIIEKNKEICKCERCGYEWAKKFEEVPIKCAGCGSPYWNRKRRNKKV